MNTLNAVFIVAVVALFLSLVTFAHMVLVAASDSTTVGIVAFVAEGDRPSIQAEYYDAGLIPPCNELPLPSFGQPVVPVACELEIRAD